MKLRRGVAVAVGLVAVLMAAPAQAESPWSYYEGSDALIPAGKRCAFEVKQEVVEDKERYRTTQYFADGSPRYQEWTGQLVLRWTNTATGESVVRNITGRGDFEYFEDGGLALYGKGGHIAVGLGVNDPAPGLGIYVVTGYGSNVRIQSDGSRTLTLAENGLVENICETLG